MNKIPGHISPQRLRKAYLKACGVAIPCRDCGSKATHLTNLGCGGRWEFACSNDDHVSEKYPYSINLDTINTYPKFLHWMHHLSGKVWFPATLYQFMSKMRLILGDGKE